MKIYYEHRQLQKATSEYRAAVREWGSENAKKLSTLIQQLQAASTLKEMHNVPGARFHPLSGDRKGQFAMDLKHPKRLIVKPIEPVPRTPDGGIDVSQVTEILVIEVVDYHD